MSQGYQTLHDLNPEELFVVSEYVCHGSATATPIYECVKVFMRLMTDGKFTYARHHRDLGSARITAESIVQGFRDESRSDVVLEALTAVEDTMAVSWPFAPGSSSWIQLEILDPSIRFAGPINRPTIIFRKASRLSRINRKLSATSTPLVENIFLTLKNDLPENLSRFETAFSPVLTLKNIAGSGIMTESVISVESGMKHPYEVAEDITAKVLTENFAIGLEMNPGFYVTTAGITYKIVSEKYSGINTHSYKEEPTLLPPLPIIGVLK